MTFRFLSQLNLNAGYEVEDEDRSSPVDEGENEESDIELDPENARARGNGNCANLDLVTLRLRRVPALNQTMTEFAWLSELHDVEIEMFTQYTGPLSLLNMSDSMQTKYNAQKSTRKPQNYQKNALRQQKFFC